MLHLEEHPSYLAPMRLIVVLYHLFSTTHVLSHPCIWMPLAFGLVALQELGITPRSIHTSAMSGQST